MGLLDVFNGKNLFLDSLGVNGAGGNARPVDAFNAGPGYDFTLNEGINAISRLRNAQGQGSGVGGNADRDATTYATGIADKTYSDWQTRLGGLVNPELAATTGAAGFEGQGAGLVADTAKSRAAVASGRGSMLADLAKTYGTSVADVDTGEATSLGNLATGAAGQKVNLATGLASPYAQTYGNEANAKVAGSGQLWNLGLNLAQLGTGLYGKKLGADALASVFAKKPAA
jgi:hypothetical protein